MLAHPQAAVALPVVALALSVFVLISTIVAVSHGEAHGAGIVFWAIAVVLSVLVVRHRVRVLRDPEGEQVRQDALRAKRAHKSAGRHE